MFMDNINPKARELLMVDSLQTRLEIDSNLNKPSLSLTSSSDGFEARLELGSLRALVVASRSPQTKFVLYLFWYISFYITLVHKCYLKFLLQLLTSKS
jgi:hypothetical protein